MPILMRLDEEEAEIFLHLLRNKNRSSSDAQRRSRDLIDESCSDELKKRLKSVMKKTLLLRTDISTKKTPCNMLRKRECQLRKTKLKTF